MKKRVISWMLAIVLMVSMILGTNVFGKLGTVQAEELNQSESNTGLNYHTDDTEKNSLVEVPEDYSYTLTTNRIFGAIGTTTSNYNDQADQFDTTYGYQDLALRHNGSERQKLYNDIMTSVKNFESSNMNATDQYHIFANFDYASKGLTLDDAVETYYMFRNDNPYYYWLSSSISYNATNIYICTYDDYYQSAVRTSYDTKIADKINEYKAAISNYQSLSNYDIALKIHNKIIDEINYAFDSQGKPEQSAWAHNIIGAMDNTHNAAVCEGYAKTYEMLLNYFGVGNVYVTGTGNGGDHAWNVVQMDDSNWYCTDVTWDDQPSWPNGIIYDYFNCNVSEFNKLHTASTPAGTGVDFLYALPTLSDSTAYMYENRNHVVPLTAISLSKTSDSILKGKTDTLTVIYNPAETTDDTTVKWKSSNESVATVDAFGTVTAVSAGTATITATTLDGTKTAGCTVTVTAFQLGDVTMDNDINIFDILEIQRYILGITTFTDHRMAAADVTKDGEVNIFDILAIQRHILGIQLIAE